MSGYAREAPSEIAGWRWRLPSLGFAQIIAWGSLYYAIALLAGDLAVATGVARTTVFGAFTLSLVVSGLAAPLAGRLIDAGHGRAVLAGSALLSVAGFLLLAYASGPALLFAAWAILGAAMGTGLYDAAFASLHRVVPLTAYRRSVTQLTLFGGFASTVFWPLTSWLVARYTAQGALVVFALLHLCICLPLYLAALPAPRDQTPVAHRAGGPMRLPVTRSRRFLALAAAFSLAAFAVSVISVHLITLLVAGGLADKQAVVVGALFGPMQVVARIVEYLVAPRVSALTVGSVSFALLCTALLILGQSGGTLLWPVLFALCYGAGNGIMTIARGTVPAQLFADEPGFGKLLGQLALPAFVAKAVAPFLFSLLIAEVQREIAIGMLLAVGLSAWGAYELARRM